MATDLLADREFVEEAVAEPERGYRRVSCRVTGCPRTVPWTPGFWVDGTCWAHHHLVVPPLAGRWS